jgi:hypothetical protein
VFFSILLELLSRSTELLPREAALRATALG